MTPEERMIRAAFPSARISQMEPLQGGFRNTNFKIRLHGFADPMVLRVYRHAPELCQKELDILRTIAAAVPAPEMIYADPRGVPPFMLMRYVEGITFLDLKRTGDRPAIAQAAFSAGETLAAIGKFTFDKPGWIGPGPSVTWTLPENFIDSCLDSPDLRRRMPVELRKRTRAFISSAPQIPGGTRLVHCDFSRRNVLVREVKGRWRVAAVIDWEFAVAGSPLTDMANFLRYELESRPIAEPHFSVGYAHGGGILPEGWRRLAKTIDLIALSEMLTREALPDDAAEEIVELLRATIEDRDPRLG